MSQNRLKKQKNDWHISKILFKIAMKIKQEHICLWFISKIQKQRGMNDQEHRRVRAASQND
ncbi:MAG: hypothetical protein KAI81_04105 [Candidatus Marinimicrobia bacterium]|nr:hypothetical protein [Candidatus Neomarinimicrobiota bacterium]